MPRLAAITATCARLMRCPRVRHAPYADARATKRRSTASGSGRPAADGRTARRARHERHPGELDARRSTRWPASGTTGYRTVRAGAALGAHLGARRPCTPGRSRWRPAAQLDPALAPPASRPAALHAPGDQCLSAPRYEDPSVVASASGGSAGRVAVRRPATTRATSGRSTTRSSSADARRSGERPQRPAHATRDEDAPARCRDRIPDQFDLSRRTTGGETPAQPWSASTPTILAATAGPERWPGARPAGSPRRRHLAGGSSSRSSRTDRRDARERSWRW